MTSRLLSWLLVFALPSLAQASSFTALEIFGDSLSDQANAFLITGNTFPPLPYAARASNGPVAVEQLAGRLGIPLAPAAAGGTNYAVIGAATGQVAIPGSAPPATTDNIATISYGQAALAGTGILNQVFASLGTGPVASPDTALFFVWGGASDLLINPSAPTAAAAVTNLGTAIGLLHGNGARHFLVPNLPNLSLTPYGRSLDPISRAGLQALSIGFNLGLASVLDSLSLLPGIPITRFDTFAFLTALALNPGAFGFANAADACLTGDITIGGIVCPDPSSFVFWDSVHPTAAAHEALGDQFAAAVVPEPATLVLVGLGLAAGRLARTRRRSTSAR